MKNNTIRYLLAGFGISLLLLIISTVASYISIGRLVDSSNLVNDANTISLKLESIISNVKDAETGFRGYVITREAKFLEPYNGAHARATENFNQVKELTANNPTQREYLENLHQLLEARFSFLEQGLVSLKTGGSVNEVLYQGKTTMDSLRSLVDKMEDEEARLLAEQNDRLRKYTSITPVLVIGAALLSILITVISFIRIRNDLKKREALQGQLEEAAESMRQRVNIITNVAEKISNGDYSTRVDDREKGELGTLADALNQMATELESNFKKLEAQSWLQLGLVSINDQLKGEKNPGELAQDVLSEMVLYLNAQVGILYLIDEEGSFLRPTATYACQVDSHKHIGLGEGLVGQVARDRKPMVIRQVKQDLFRVQSGLLDGTPSSVLIYPLIFNDILLGIVEIGTVQDSTDLSMEYLERACENTAIAINTSQNRLRVDELLQETQAQAEELQVQQDELQRSNVELEIQSQKLQASEEELRVQQEELLQSNQELEEKAQLLEENNQYIEQKSRELQQLNDEVELKNKELEQASRYKSEFLANMSHELRTPLNSILLLAKLLAESKELDLGDDRYEYARVIHSSGQGLLELINEILDLSKIEAGQMEISIEEVALEEVKKDMDSIFSPVAKDKGLNLVLNFDKDVPAAIQSDKLRLEQILKNLLSNAIKFTDKGTVELNVYLPETTVRFGNGRLQNTQVIAFKVKDTGIGIPKDKQGLVFEAFKQVDGSTRRKYAGTGLGLSISREIAKLLGGEIQLESEPGQGSEFTVFLPVNYIAEPVIEDVVANAPANPAPETTEASSTEDETVSQPEQEALAAQVPDDRDIIQKDDKSILIVEDDILFVKALSPFVKSNGYKVLIATRGDEGVALAKKYQPVGILLDINLPVMDGWSVIEHLKKDYTTRHIPVHTMSSEEARRKSLSLGAIDFINKPMAEQELDGVLNRIEAVGNKTSRMLLIIEENKKHADALSTYFRQHNIDTSIALSGEKGMDLLKREEYDVVILDISVHEQEAYKMLDKIKQEKAFETLPVIVYTGQTITADEENRINKYAATSIVKRANTYEKLLNEVSIFLHLVDERLHDSNKPEKRKPKLIDRGLEGKTVLLVDDDPRNVFSLSKVLNMQQVNVITAANGREALEKLEEQPQLDAVLIDMMMPEMDGYETTRAIRKMQEYKNIPIIAVTAKTMPNDRNKCIEAGASDYISKPVDIDQLLSLLRVWLY